MAQMPSLYPWPPVVVRSNGSTAFARSIAESVRRLNPAIKFRMFPLQSAVDQVLAADRMTAWLAGGFGVLALVLVMAGLYGLIAYLTVGRTNEIGIRLSLGSTRSQIVGLVVRDAVWMIAIGIAAGIPLSLGAMEAAKALLFGLSPTDPRTVVAALTGLAAAAALAGAVPAWRASRLDPNVVLRAE
jgi:ABC-type antimicrobial peptide transport system permease subunit